MHRGPFEGTPNGFYEGFLRVLLFFLSRWGFRALGWSRATGSTVDDLNPRTLNYCGNYGIFPYSPRPQPKRSEVPIRIPSIPHLLIPSPLTPTPQSYHRGGGGPSLCEPIIFRLLQWIWAVSPKIPSCSLPPPSPPSPPCPLPPPPPPPILYIYIYIFIYLFIYLFNLFI